MTSSDLPPIAFSVADLLALDDERFVRRAFHALVARDPAPAELALWRDRVDQGWPRLMVVAALGLSSGGWRRSVRVRGLVTEFLGASLSFPFRRLTAWRRWR